LKFIYLLVSEEKEDRITLPTNITCICLNEHDIGKTTFNC